MFFARLVVSIGDMLQPGKLRGRLFQIFDYIGCRQKVIAWHRAELERMAPVFDESVKRSLERIANGSGIDWKEEARVHAEVLERYRRTGKERMRRLVAAVEDMDDTKDYPQERVDAVTQACVSALKRKD